MFCFSVFWLTTCFYDLFQCIAEGYFNKGHITDCRTSGHWDMRGCLRYILLTSHFLSSFLHPVVFSSCSLRWNVHGMFEKSHAWLASYIICTHPPPSPTPCLHPLKVSRQLKMTFLKELLCKHIIRS